MTNNDKFFCPYAVHRQEVFSSTAFEGEDGKYHTQQQFVNKAVFADCLRERCGVFYDGKCHYTGKG